MRFNNPPTLASVVAALGYTPANQAGDTFTGPVSFSGATNNGIRVSNLTTTQKNALTALAGNIVYDSTLARLQGYDGAAWHSYTRLDGDTMTGALGITGGTVVVSTPLLNATQTWNDGAVTFTGLKLNITATASAAASLLADLQVAGVSKFSVDKSGGITLAGGLTSASAILFTAGSTTFNIATSGPSIFSGSVTISGNLALLGTFNVPGITTAAFTSAGTFTSGAGALVGTLTNSPVTGNPTTWIKIVDNGVTRYIPAW